MPILAFVKINGQINIQINGVKGFAIATFFSSSCTQHIQLLLPKMQGITIKLFHH
jgi:hypothetical protein